MQQWFTENTSLISSLITIVITGTLSALLRNVSKNVWWLQVLRFVLQSGWNYFQAGSEVIHRSEVAKRITAFVVCFVSLATLLVAVGCTSATPSTTSAYTANGKQWPLCLELDFTTAIPVVKDWSLLACATTDATLADAKKSAIEAFKVEHPDAKLVLEARLPTVSLEKLKAMHPGARIVAQ